MRLLIFALLTGSCLIGLVNLPATQALVQHSLLLKALLNSPDFPQRVEYLSHRGSGRIDGIPRSART